MAKKKSVTGFKTKSKKHKKAKKPKSKKCKEEKDKAARKLGLGVQEICSALTDLQVDPTVAGKSSPPLKSSRKTRSNIKRNEKEQIGTNVETNISRLFKKLSCSSTQGSMDVKSKIKGMLIY